MWQDRVIRECSEQVEIDHTLLQAVVRGELPATIRLWSNSPALVVSTRDTHRPHYQRAVDTLAERGTQVVVRTSGGTAVLHGPGIVNFSMVYPVASNDRVNIDAAYTALCQPLIDTLANLGLRARLQSVDGAFCDGRFNLAIRGRKLGGTAQRISRAQGEQAVLAHVTTLIDADLESFCALLEDFYRLSGDARALPVSAVTSVNRELATVGVRPLSATEFEDRLIQTLTTSEQ